MGDKTRTIQNLEIIKSDLENNLIFLKGSVPGSKNSFVLIHKNAKNINRATSIDKAKKIKVETGISPVKKATSKSDKTPKDTKKETVKKEEVNKK